MFCTQAKQCTKIVIFIMRRTVTHAGVKLEVDKIKREGTALAQLIKKRFRGAKENNFKDCSLGVVVLLRMKCG